MYCLRCGRETENQQIFCSLCMEEMKEFPVKPDSVIHLPVRTAPPVSRHRRRVRPKKTPELKIRILRKKVRGLAISLTVALLLLIGCICMLLFGQRYVPDLAPGQNYQTNESTAPQTEA